MMVMATEEALLYKVSKLSKEKTEERQKESLLEGTKSVFNLQGCDTLERMGHCAKSNKTNRQNFIARVLCHHQVAEELNISHRPYEYLWRSSGSSKPRRRR
jgi:hypothetical protein